MTRVRFREDVGWEMRCDDCKASGRSGFYWPLLPVGEFWDPLWHARCKACELRRRNRRDCQLRATQPRRRMDNAARARLYYWRDPESKRAIARRSYAKNRDAILEKRKAAYRARVAA